MWIISDRGFVSLVQHDTDPGMIRARARRKAHLLDTFPHLGEDEIIDYGPTPPDYRFHANVVREDVAEAIADSIMDLSYTSHVKESVSGTDKQMYRAMMSAWNAFYELQRPPLTDGDWWTSRFEGEDDDDEVLSAGKQLARRLGFPDDDEFDTEADRSTALRSRLGITREHDKFDREIARITRPSNRGRQRRDDWWRNPTGTPTKPRDDGRADKPLEELTGSLADKMLKSAGRLDQPTTEFDNLFPPAPKQAPAKKAAAKKIPPPPAAPRSKKL